MKFYYQITDQNKLYNQWYNQDKYTVEDLWLAEVERRNNQ